MADGGGATGRQRMGAGRRLLLAALALLLLAGAARAELPVLAYVTNQGDDSVSVVDTRSGAVTETVRVGAKPAGVAVAPGGQRIYVTNPEGHSVSVLERRGASHVVVAEIPVGAGPLGVVVSPGTRLVRSAVTHQVRGAGHRVDQPGGRVCGRVA